MTLTALIVAIQNADYVAFEALLAANPLLSLDGVDDNSSGPNGLSALHWASHCDEPQMLATLLEHKTVDPTVKNKRGNSVLHTAAARGCVRALRQLLRSGRVVVNAVNLWGESALHLAASADQAEAVALLLDAGADMNLLDSWGRSPLCVACENGSQNATTRLQRAGAVNVGQSRVERDEGQGRSLQEAVGSELLEVLSARNNTAVSPQLASSTVPASLVIVSSENSPPASLPPSLKQKAGLPALSKFVEFPGDPVMVEKLLREGKVDPAGLDMFGWSALHKFAAWDKVDLLALLMPFLTPGQ